ncbi:MAG: DUF4276 family protein [Candidatus Brocadiia bacterium]
MSNPAFIVDGQMEQKIIQKICPGQPVRLLQCNGRNVSYEAAAKKAASLIRLQKRYQPIIIIFDREGRPDNHRFIANALYRAIEDQGIPKVTVIIGVPDRMIENWLLADIKAVNCYYSKIKPIKQKIFEGNSGKSRIRSLIGRSQYSETQDGPEIFIKCNQSCMCQNSDSFNEFYGKIKTIKCRWLHNVVPTTHNTPNKS